MISALQEDTLVLGCSDGVIRIIDLQSNAVLREQEIHKGGVIDIMLIRNRIDRSFIMLTAGADDKKINVINCN